nr:thiamine pyrophosphate-dependent enzyme [Chelatococcus asaccharovorans]
MFETEVVPPRLGSISTSVVRPARSIADPAAVADAVTLLRDAQRPLLLVGGGAVGCDANEEVLRVAELLQAPVATTWTGKGIIAEDHPLALGILGNAAGYPGLEDAAKAADLIFMVGTKSSQNSTYRWTIPSIGQKVIHLDVDGMETGRVFRTDVSLVGDARLVLTQLADALTGSAKVDRPEWRAKYSDVLKRARVELGRQAALDFVPIAPQRVVDEISKAAAAQDVFVCDASFASAWGAMYYSIKQAGRRTIFPRGMAGLGFGLPAAVGAAAGRPDASVFLLSGDGGFAYSVQELAVAVKFGLKVRAIVINNGSYGWIKHSYSARFGGDLAETHMPRFDYVAVANGMGCPAIRVEKPEDLAAALRTAADASGPFLVEVITSAEESPIVSHRGKAADPYKAPADPYAVTENA